MRVKIFAGVGLALTVALVAAAAIVVNSLSTQATDEVPSLSKSQTTVPARADAMAVGQATRPDDIGQAQASPDTEAKLYIGAFVNELDDGSVNVVNVIEGGPSDGILEAGDIITGVGGETIDGFGDLTDAIEDAGAGATLALSIMRDGANMDVIVVVGEWTEPKGLNSGSASKIWRAEDNVAIEQVVMADDDGNYRAYRTVFGEIAELDVDAETFTLQPKDGSSPIQYDIDDDTRIVVDSVQVDGLSSLNMDERTVVMDVDGKVEIVEQGGYVGSSGFKPGMGMMKGFGLVDKTHDRAFHDRDDISDIQKIIDSMDLDGEARLDLGGMARFRGAWRGRDSDSISFLLEGIDDSVMSAYAPDGFEESLRQFMEEPGSGGKIFVRWDDEGLEIRLWTDEGEMNFTIPAAALNEEDSF